MDVNDPIEIEGGYFEFRVNWNASDLMQMSGVQLDHLKKLIEDFKGLANVMNGQET